MKKNIFLISVLAFFFLIMTVLPNYFLLNQSPTYQRNQNVSQNKSKPFNNYFYLILKKLSRVQRDLRKNIVESTKALKKEASPRHFMIILFFSFIFGIIHSIGPGHAKSIIFSYFLTMEARIKDGIILGGLVAIVHGISGFLAAVIVTFSVNQVIHRVFFGFNTETIMPFVSGSFVIGIGGYFFVKTCFDLKKSSKSINKRERVKEVHSFINVLYAALGIGIIPCAGTVILVSFFLAIKRIDLGIFSAISMSAGMATIIIFSGIFSIISKQIFISIWKDKIYQIIIAARFIGSFALLIFGVLLVCP